MKWLLKMNRALAAYGYLVTWFDEASRDGVLTADEIAEGVAGLVDVMGYGGKIKVEPLNLE